MKTLRRFRLLALLIATLAGVYALSSLWLYATQQDQVYHPTPEKSVAGVTHLFLDTGEVRLKVWTLNPGRSKALLYFGGNAEDVAENLTAFQTMFPDRSVYLMNYRGYGGSTGTPSEEGLCADAELAYDYIAKKHASVAVMGRSIGTGVATCLAARRDVEKLLLVTPFDSLRAVAQERYPYFPVSWLLRDQFDSAKRAPSVHAPVLVIIAEEDTVVPPEHAQNLAHAFVNVPIDTVILSGVNHDSVRRHPAYAGLLSDFLRR